MSAATRARRDPTLDDDDAAVLAFLAELQRSESGPFSAAGGPAPRAWLESEGAPGHTRGGMLRLYGRVERLPGAE